MQINTKLRFACRLSYFLIFLCSAGAAVQAEDRGVFRVVALLPLTGALAEYGVAAKNGFELARQEDPEAFRNLEFVYDDSKYDTKLAISSYRSRQGSDKAALYYVWGYGICQALAPIAESEKTPLIAASAEQAVSANRSYVLRFNYHYEQISKALLDYLRSKNLKHLVVVKTELAYFNGVLDGLKKLLRPGETLEVAGAFDMGEMDFKSTLAKLRLMQFDALGVFLVGGQGSQFYRQMEQLRFKAQTFGTDFFDSATVAQEAQGAMDGVVFAAQETSERFRARYHKTYGNDFQAAWAANSYEFAMLMAQLFGKRGAPLSGEQIMAALKGAQIKGAGAAEYGFSNSKDGAGFDFKAVLRKIDGERVVDFGEGG